MKKQIITVAAVALAAILLFGVYSIFLKDDGIETDKDPFYNIGKDVEEELGKLKDKVKITLNGYDADDENWVMISAFASSLRQANKKISVSESESGNDRNVTVALKDNEKKIQFDDFFKKLYDGTIYAFDGENLICNAIFSLAGKETKEISLHAMKGYDIDGDMLAQEPVPDKNIPGRPFVFMPEQRENISFLNIRNSHGEYAIYQENGQFFFSESRLIKYNDEKFSMLTTNCRYPVAVGKMNVPEGKTYKDYKLDKEENAKASYTITTKPDKDGRYFLHTVLIGSLDATGTAYYARYLGGQFEKSGDKDEKDKMIHSLSKDRIYLLPASDMNQSVMAPSTDIMSATLVYGIRDPNETGLLDNIRIDYYKENILSYVRNLSAFNPSENLATKDQTTLIKVLSDKKTAGEYGSYEGGWLKNTGVFAGCTSSDGKDTYFDAALMKYAKDGKYRINLGLLRDDKQGAVLPYAITLTCSDDGINFYPVEGGVIKPSQDDRTVKRYVLEFTCEKRIKYLRIEFDVPHTKETYVVFDEIRIYASGEDAQPSDSINGVYKMVRPDQFIPDGRNFAYLDFSNFNDFIYSISTLKDNKVVACGISENGDPDKMDTEKLKKFGLDDPERHYAYEYNGVTTDLYVSKVNEHGNYYVYSVFSGEDQGKELSFCTDAVCEITPKEAPWLTWKFVEMLDHSLISMFITEIKNMEISFGGNDYFFVPTMNEDGDIEYVTFGDERLNGKSFNYLYRSILKIYMHDEYVLQDDDRPEEYLHIKVHAETRDTEIVFYRINASQCYFTVDGEGSYYALAEDVNIVIENVLKYIKGEEVR